MNAYSPCRPTSDTAVRSECLALSVSSPTLKSVRHRLRSTNNGMSESGWLAIVAGLRNDWTRPLTTSASVGMEAVNSYGCGRDAWMCDQGLARGVLERLIRRQDDGRGPHALMLERHTGRHRALLGERLDRAQQLLPRHDDAAVGRDERLFRAVDDRSHAFLDRRILHGEALDAAVAASRLLRGAIHQVVVVLVGDRPVVRIHLGVDALAVAHRRQLRLRQRARRVIVEAPRPAVLVVNRDPE